MRQTIRVLSLLIIVSGLTGWLITGCDEGVEEPDPVVTSGPVLIVANQAGGAGNLSMVTLETGAVQYAVAGLGITPNDIIFDDDKLYVVNSGSHNMNILNVSDNNVISSVDTVDLGVADNRWPQHGVIADNGRMYITNLTPPGSVSVLNMSTMMVSILILVNRAPADVMAIGDKIYVCNTGYHDGVYDIGTISIISAASNSVEKIINVGLNPRYMALDPSNRLHVICSGDYVNVEGEVHIINTQADTVAQVINLGGQPEEVAIAPNGIAYVAAGGYAPQPAGLVYSYNSLTGQILHGPNNPIEVGLGASRIVANTDNSIYVSCFGADRVDKIVGDSRVASYQVGDDPGPLYIIE